MDRAADFFSARGWRVSAGDSVFARELRFAGSDQLRAAELQRFATDRSLDVAIAARGGYGLTRILGDLDYEAIAAAGVPLVGYSDFTAFNLALLAQAGGISFQGPAASDFFLDTAAGTGKDLVSARFNQEHFFAAISQAEHTTHFAGDADAARYEGLDLRGRLWGGNLTMVCSLLGTRYFPNVRGGILFLEDVNESAYRIERLLLQLLQAGVLARQKAIVLGEFAAVPVLPTDNGYDLTAVREALRARCPVPIFGGLPLGHGSLRATLAVGAPARLTIERAPLAQGDATRGTGAPATGVNVHLQYRGHPTLRPVAVGASGRRLELDRKIPA
jgi:muramoyltetrapeptide carboxypeptidase